MFGMLDKVRSEVAGSDQVGETEYWQIHAIIPVELGKQKVVIRTAIHKGKYDE